MMTAFAANLRRLMAEHHMARGQLAARLGVSIVTIGHWRSGRWICKVPQAIKLAQTFGTNVEDLFAEKTAHRPQTKQPSASAADENK